MFLPVQHVKSWLIGKDSDVGRDWGQEEKGMTEDEMAGWHHWLDGRESEWTPGVGDRQGGLVCCDLWGRKELDTTKRLNWTELIVDLQCYLTFSYIAKWFGYTYTYIWDFPGGSVEKTLPSMQEMQVQPQGREDPRRRKCQPTPAFLPRKSHGQRSLVGYSPRDHKEFKNKS